MESVIEKAIEWFKDISEATKELTSGNVSHKACAIRGLANGSAEYLEEYKVGLSAIRWQTGEPKEFGLYLVTLNDGSVATDEWYKFSDVDDWHYFWNEVKSWCKLSDIEPYKEEQPVGQNNKITFKASRYEYQVEQSSECSKQHPSAKPLRQVS